MWTCPLCHQQFLHSNQRHSCNERTLEDFLKGKSEHTTDLYYYFIDEYRKIGDFVLHPAKSRIGLAHTTRFCSINQLGKNFIHIVFQFKRPYHDNFCFTRIGQLPGTSLYNHHCRLYHREDLNDEVRRFMSMAYYGEETSVI